MESAMVMIKPAELYIIIACIVWNPELSERESVQ
jgi:hypothetical protein